MNNQHKKFSTLTGLALIGCSITGVASLVAALFPFTQADYDSVGLYLVAAALSFGLLANALLRD